MQSNRELAILLGRERLFAPVALDFLGPPVPYGVFGAVAMAMALIFISRLFPFGRS